jgi:hypothetical protein
MHSKTRQAALHATSKNTAHQHKLISASRGPICIREEDKQHCTQQVRTQPTNTNSYIERTYMHWRTRHATLHATSKNTAHELKLISASRGHICSRRRHGALHETNKNRAHKNKLIYREDLYALENMTRSTTRNK